MKREKKLKSAKPLPSEKESNLVVMGDSEMNPPFQRLSQQ